ncbi:hypothetical protein [Devosia marina]|uniref:Uncharacterized protein n=1 Tax=Devosia marina TaxID=2683198 RepID=A0A7X3FRG0_9HYPH|nr:hypothetical protein [Devosia marina]MVS99271.1 hypothetical protein [Devosia marina]
MNALAIPFPLVSPQELAAVIADRIEAHARAMDALIVLLDALDGDPDLEPSLGAPEAKVDLPWGTVFMVRTQDGDQSMWADGVNDAPTDDAEAVNEDGDELASGELSCPIPGGSDLTMDSLHSEGGK